LETVYQYLGKQMENREEVKERESEKTNEQKNGLINPRERGTSITICPNPS